MPAIIYQMKANPENHGKLFQGIKTITGNINLNDYEKVAVLLDDEIKNSVSIYDEKFKKLSKRDKESILHFIEYFLSK